MAEDSGTINNEVELLKEEEEDFSLDHSPVETKELRGWYNFGFARQSTVLPDMLWLATLIFMISSITYSTSYVFFYAWVPILTRYHPDTIKAREDGLEHQEYYAVSDRVGNSISSQGFLWGYVAAVIQLIIGAGIALAMGSGAKYGLPSVYPLQVGVAVSCVWTLAFLPTTIKWLKPRPGAPLPEGENFALFSLKKLGRTLSKATKLGQLFLFLIGWFIYSDGFTTVIAVAILYFRSEVNVGQTTLLIAATIVPLFAGIGCIVWNYLQRVFKLQTKTVIIIQSSLYALVCVYALIGFVTPAGSFGIKSKIEIFPLAIVHGFLLGATQSSCRVLFSELLPPGFESEFFSLYEITDKGSAWVGPLIVGLIGDTTHNKRNSFFFLLCMFLIPCCIFAFIDVTKGKKQAHEFAKAESIHEAEKLAHKKTPLSA
eukprot:jgi/Hompol1/6702/HPOL_000304-RA